MSSAVLKPPSSHHDPSKPMESPVHLTTNPAHTQLQGPAAAEYREAWMQALEPWHIERLQLTFDQPVPSIGDAGVGSVRRATFHNNSIGTSTRVAVKIVRKSDGGALPLVQVSRSDVTHFATNCTNRVYIAKLGQEILIQAGFNHPNVLPFFRYWLSPDSTEVFLLRPDAPFGSISEHVESSHATDLEKIKLVRYLVGVFRIESTNLISGSSWMLPRDCSIFTITNRHASTVT